MAELDPIIGAEAAIALLDAGQACFIDASWTFPGGPKPRSEGVIPGALAFDIDTVRDAENALPHMLPAPAVFARHVGEMGICDQTRLVIYDRMGLFAAPRVWWMFSIMGHGPVQVLDGGLPAWIQAGGPVADRHDRPGQARPYQTNFQAHRLVSRTELMTRLGRVGQQVIDVRSPGRFSGHEAEPRAGMRSGHMPGALNLHYASLLENGHLRADRAALERAGIEFDRDVIASCGSGVTACILALALYREGKDAAVYDGSWVEWSQHAATQVVKDED